MSTGAHLAQVNIGRIRAPMDSPTMAGFASRLDEINALADFPPDAELLRTSDWSGSKGRPTAPA
jgi:hypothetical protein